MKKFFTIFLTITVLISFKSEANNKKGNDGWITTKGSSYEIEHPSDWQYIDPKNNQVTFYLLAPMIDSNDKFGDNVSLAIEPLSKENNTLEKFAKASERKIEQFVTGSRIISQETIGKKKKAFHRIEYRATYPETDGVYWLQYYILKNNKAYIITAMMVENQKEKFLEVMTEILDSFKVKKVKETNLLLTPTTSNKKR